MRADRPPIGPDAATQLELFDGTLAEPGRAQDELPVARERPRRSSANLEAAPIKSVEPSDPAAAGRHAGADRATLAALEAALVDARSAADDRPALVVLASRLRDLGTLPIRPPAGRLSLRQARDDWLRRLEASQKARARSSRTESRSTTCSTGRRRTGEASSRRRRSSTTCARTSSGHGLRRRRTTGASSSCASSFGGSANGKASATHSPTSTRRRSRGRSVTG
jgi:hypothetical protein